MKGIYKAKEYSNIQIGIKDRIIKLPKIVKVQIREWKCTKYLNNNNNNTRSTIILQK